MKKQYLQLHVKKKNPESAIRQSEEVKKPIIGNINKTPLITTISEITNFISPISMIIFDYYFLTRWEDLMKEEKANRRQNVNFSCLDIRGKVKITPFEYHHVFKFPDESETELVKKCFLIFSNYSYSLLCSRDLTNANLHDSNFTGADFTHVNLTNANLRWSNFSGANFTDANLTNSDTTKANFYNAILIRTIMSIDQIAKIEEWDTAKDEPDRINMMGYYLYSYCSRQKKAPPYKRLVQDCLRTDLDEKKAACYLSEIKELTKKPSETDEFVKCLRLMRKDFSSSYDYKFYSRLKKELPGLQKVIAKDPTLRFSPSS